MAPASVARGTVSTGEGTRVHCAARPAFLAWSVRGVGTPPPYAESAARHAEVPTAAVTEECTP